MLALSFSAARAGDQIEDIAETLRRNQRKWAEQQAKEYQFVFRLVCFCIPEFTRPVVINVREGKIVAVRYADRDQAPIAPENFNRYQTVDELFAIIQQAIEQKAHRINVTYHPKRGAPTSVFIDYSANMADEERGYEIRALKVKR
jgi:hypothetical protein